MLPIKEIELIVAHVLQVDQVYLKAYPELLAEGLALPKVKQLIARRMNHEPIAYLLGYKDFWDLSFKVDNSVLIPRSDTELLVELALELLPNYKEPRIIDLGTGSGCIALTIAKHQNNAEIWAVDYSYEAIKIAKENAKNLHVADRVNFVVTDWLASFNPGWAADLIISNPPYIAKTELDLCDPDLAYEPELALFAENNGMAEFVKIVDQARIHLKLDGIIMLEHGYSQKKELITLLQTKQFIDIKSYKDLAQKDRVLVAKRG